MISLLEGVVLPQEFDVCSICVRYWMRNLVALCQKVKTVDKKNWKIRRNQREGYYCTHGVLRELRRR